ncbi:MAG: hypothetical protein ACXWLR_09705 [Myxococcales bacterium]
MMRVVAGMFVAVAPAIAVAQAPPSPPVRIRGTIEKLDGQNLTIKARSGQSMSVKLADKFMVVGIFKGSVADITSGKFIGTTTLGERDGALVAQEVHIFPETMRGTGEGHYDWDLKPDSKMTNANVANVVNMANDHVMNVQYKGGEKKILVTKDTVVVKYQPVDSSELKPGAPVFVVSQRQADGSLSAARVNVGMNGQVPPM